jgi:hypothetical protein
VEHPQKRGKIIIFEGGEEIWFKDQYISPGLDMT